MDYKVIMIDSTVFNGSYGECKNYIVTKFSPAEVDSLGDYLDIINCESGRCASYVLEWK